MNDLHFPAWCNRIPAGLACLDIDGTVLFANPVAAASFVAYVRYTPSAQGILRAYGFARPW